MIEEEGELVTAVVSLWAISGPAWLGVWWEEVEYAALHQQPHIFVCEIKPAREGMERALVTRLL